MQVSSSKNLDAKKLPNVLSSSGLLAKYIDNVKSMNALTALQYRSELNSFARFVYNAYGCDVDSLIGELYNKGTLQKKQILILMKCCQDMLHLWLELFLRSPSNTAC